MSYKFGPATTTRTTTVDPFPFPTSFQFGQGTTTEPQVKVNPLFQPPSQTNATSGKPNISPGFQHTSKIAVSPTSQPTEAKPESSALEQQSAKVYALLQRQGYHVDSRRLLLEAPFASRVMRLVASILKHNPVDKAIYDATISVLKLSQIDSVNVGAVANALRQMLEGCFAIDASACASPQSRSPEEPSLSLPTPEELKVIEAWYVDDIPPVRTQKTMVWAVMLDCLVKTFTIQAHAIDELFGFNLSADATSDLYSHSSSPGFQQIIRPSLSLELTRTFLDASSVSALMAEDSFVVMLQKYHHRQKKIDKQEQFYTPEDVARIMTLKEEECAAKLRRVTEELATTQIQLEEAKQQVKGMTSSERDSAEVDGFSDDIGVAHEPREGSQSGTSDNFSDTASDRDVKTPSDERYSWMD